MDWYLHPDQSIPQSYLLVSFNCGPRMSTRTYSSALATLNGSALCVIVTASGRAGCYRHKRPSSTSALSSSSSPLPSSLAAVQANLYPLHALSSSWRGRRKPRFAFASDLHAVRAETALQVTARVEYDRARPPSPSKPHIPTLSPPAIKPRAKVNSSATVVNRKAQVSRTASPAPSLRSPPSARAPSPFKPTFPGISQSTSATSVPGVRARLTTRPLSQQSPTGPESRQRSLTTVPSDSALSSRGIGGRPRRGSVSSHASLTISPTHAELRAQSHRPPMSPSENGSPLPSPLSSPHPKGITRVKSKVSSATSSPHTSPPPSKLPNGHNRAPSIPAISLATPLLPADNASPVPTLAYPHTAGDSPTHKHVYQPLASLEDVIARYGNYTVTAKVDPAAIPLPPQSPPMSTVSFSSRSSASRSSVSYEHGTDISRSTAPTVHSRVNGHSRYARASMDGSDVRSDAMTPSEDESWDDDEITKVRPLPREDPDRKIKDEAKSNRKVGLAIGHA